MQRRKFSIWFMLLVGVMMLSIEVVPHHHHKGVPCFEIAGAEQPDSSDTDSDDTHACKCIAEFYAAETGGHTHHESYCNHFPSVTLLEDMLSFCLLIPEQTLFTYIPVYIESRHATFVSCSSGLRAPPAFARS